MGLLWFALIMGMGLLPVLLLRQRPCQAHPSATPMPPTDPRAAADGPKRPPAPCASSPARGAHPPCRTHEARRPLRVVRMSDADQRPGHAGRMRISGRMVDVCAELERLAAHEDGASCC